MKRQIFWPLLFFAFHFHLTMGQEVVVPIYEDYVPTTMRYWFDKDYAGAKELPYASGTTTIDVNALPSGFHTLHFQVIDNHGAASAVHFSTFFIPERSVETTFEGYAPKTMRYWFDKDYAGAKELPYASGTTTIDVNALPSGFHTLHFQVIDNHGTTSAVHFSTFFIPERSVETTFEGYAPKTMRYWFDKDYTSATELPFTSGTTAIDITALQEGFHTLYYQVLDDKGATSPVRFSAFFIPQRSIENIQADYAVTTVRYWFDNDATTTRTDSFTEGAIALDLSFLSEGTHTLHYQLETDDGQVSPVCSIDIDRLLYDIYIRRLTNYNADILGSDPVFTSKPHLKLHYNPDNIEERGHLTLAEDATFSLGKFAQTVNWGSNNSNSKYSKAGIDYYHPTTLIAQGQMRADSVEVKQTLYRERWHFLSLPFNVNVSEIGAPADTYWALRGYDGAARAAGLMNDCWTNLRKGEMLKAGKGYIVQLIKEGKEKASTLTFKAVNDTKKNNIFTTADVAIPLEEHLAEFAHNRSWNLVGNPYPSFFDTRCIDQKGNIIVWSGNGYTAYSLTDDNYILMPFEAFFIQKPVNVETLTFSKEGRQHTHEAQPRTNVRKMTTDRRLLNFTLSNGTDTDRSRIVINEQTSLGYETDKDAPKFMEKQPLKPQLFSIEGGVQYAINERPMGDGLIVFSVFTPTDGEYRFSVEGDVNNMIVQDAETGTIWALADGDYVFTASEGMHQARLVVSLTGETTLVSQIDTYADGEMKITNGQLDFSFMRDKHIKLYGLDGRTLLNRNVNHASIKVSRGVYLVEFDGKTKKIMVK